MTTAQRAEAVNDEMATSLILAQMQERMAALEAQNAELIATRNGDPDGSLETAVQMFAQDRVSPTAYTTTPCKAVIKGVECRRPQADHVTPDGDTPAKIRSHTFRTTPFQHIPKPKPRLYYAKDDPVVAVSPSGAIEDTYMTEKQAAERLGLTVIAVRKMVKGGQLKADRIGTVTLVRKEAVERIVVLAEIAAEEEGAE